MRRTSVAPLLAGAVTLLAGCSGAPPRGSDPVPISAPPVATTNLPPTATFSPSVPVPTLTITEVTQAMARTIALQIVGGGRVTAIETADESGIPVWQVTVLTDDAKRHLVSIEKASGAIVANVTA
jgi:hypothetical protein